jgi:hypothetical protein
MEARVLDPELSGYGRKLLGLLDGLFKVGKRYRRLKASKDPDDPDGPRLEGEAREFLEETRRLVRPLKEASLAPLDKKKARSAAKRFLDWPEDYHLAFMTDEGLGVGMTNNAAERSVLAVVIDRHATRGTRSPMGRACCERAWTAISSCAMRKRSAFAFVKAAIRAHFRGIVKHPSLLFKDDG